MSIRANFPNIRPTLNLDFANTKSLDPRITFTRATIGTYFDAAGVLQTAAAGQARFDHDPVTGESLGLLIEEARTNLLLNSATLSTQGVTVSATAYTLTFWGTGSVTLSGTYTGSLVGTGSANRVSLTFTPTAGTLTLTVTGTVSNSQLEAGAFPTSYIPTTSAAVTRNADVAVMSGTNFSSWYNQSEGSFIAEANYAEQLSGARNWFFANSGSTADQIRIEGGQGSAAVSSAVYVGSVYQGGGGGGTHVPYSWEKAAFGYKLNDSVFAFNAFTQPPDTSILIPSNLNQMSIGNRGGGNFLNGHIKRLAYYSQRLTNAQLQVLTA